MQYDAIPSKESASLYMVHDDSTGVKAMYKGDKKVGGDFVVINGTAPTNPDKGTIYYISEFTTNSSDGGG